MDYTASVGTPLPPSNQIIRKEGKISLARPPPFFTHFDPTSTVHVYIFTDEPDVVWRGLGLLADGGHLEQQPEVELGEGLPEAQSLNKDDIVPQS